MTFNFKVRSVPLYKKLNHQALLEYDELWLCKLLTLPSNPSLVSFSRQFLVSLLASNFYIPESPSNDIHESVRLGFSFSDNSLLRRAFYGHQKIVIDNPHSNLYKFLSTLKLSLGFEAGPLMDFYKFGGEPLFFPIRGNIPSLQKRYFEEGLKTTYPKHLHANMLFLLYNRTPLFSLIDIGYHTKALSEYLNAIAFSTVTNVELPPIPPLIYKDLTERNSFPLYIKNKAEELIEDDEWLFTSNHLDISDSSPLIARSENPSEVSAYLEWYAHSWLPSASSIYSEIKNTPAKIKKELRDNFAYVKRGKYIS